MNEIFAIIPARSGSKGVKNKNIKKLHGHSLLEWSINAALESKLIDRVFVSTDSEDYARIAKELGAEVPFLRPAEISSDGSTDFDFVIHAINEFKKEDLYPEYLVHLRPTTPIRDPDIIDEAISIFKENTEFHSLRSVHLMSETAYKTLEINDGFLTPLSLIKNEGISVNAPRQSFPETYVANGYVDILSTDFIIENADIHGVKIFPYITQPSFEVDSIEDFDYLEYLAMKSQVIIDKLF